MLNVALTLLATGHHHEYGLIGSHFGNMFYNMLRVTEPAPLVDYVYSMSPPFVPAASRRTEFHDFVVRELEEQGRIGITRDMGVVAATRS